VQDINLHLPEFELKIESGLDRVSPYREEIEELHGHGILDWGVGVVAGDFDVLEVVVEDILWFALENEGGLGAGVAAELLFYAFDLVEVDVAVAAGPDEVAGFEVALLGDEVGQEGILGDVEDHADRTVHGALVELTGEAPSGDVELKERVAGGQGGASGADVVLGTLAFVGKDGGIPCSDEVAARFGFIPDLLDDLADLVYYPAVRGLPGPPLRAVHGAEVSFFIGPGIPYMDVIVLEVFDVGVTGEEPEEFADDAFEKDFSRGDEREAFRQVEAQLRAENAQGSGAGPVAALDALVEDSLKEIEVLLHLWGLRLGFRVSFSEMECGFIRPEIQPFQG